MEQYILQRMSTGLYIASFDEFIGYTSELKNAIRLEKSDITIIGKYLSGSYIIHKVISF